MRLPHVWNILLAAGYWCLLQVTHAQVQQEELTTQVACPSYYTGYCLNGGQCIYVVGHNFREAKCLCPLERIGRRCEAFSPVVLNSQRGKPATIDRNYIIAGSVCGGIILLALLGILCVYVSWKRGRRNSQDSQDVEKSRPENGHVPVTI